MKHLTRLACLVTVSLITLSCVSTQSVADRLGTQYLGKNFDEFVIRHGVPEQKFALSSGDILYTWHSGLSVPTPMSAHTTSHKNLSGSITSNTTFSGGQSIQLLCKVQFITTPNGIIKQIDIVHDTIGAWTTSMCHEVF